MRHAQGIASRHNCAQAGSAWFLIPMGKLITSMRECQTLHQVRGLPLLQSLLRPDKTLALPPGQRPASVWPNDVSLKVFVEHIRSQYDAPQCDAIVMAATHLVRDEEKASAEGTFLPFTLIQGPPGTGKTHTVMGILNTWHLIQYQRYNRSWTRYVRSEAAALAAAGSVADGRLWSDAAARDRICDILTVDAEGLDPKPRILVCAPSNAATDELLERLLKSGFRDGSGRPYRPDVVRVGNEEALSDDARRVRRADPGCSWLNPLVVCKGSTLRDACSVSHRM